MADTSDRVKLSVVIPTFNRAHTLARAIESVLAQDRDDTEIIVVDDGSTDDTPRVLSGYGSALRVFHQVNTGASSARNTGVQHARGEYLAFLDSDDIWEPGKLAAQLDLLEKRPDVALVCTASASTDGRHLGKLRGDRIGDLYELLYATCFVRTSTVVMTSACFNAAGGFDTQYVSAEDYDLWLRVAAKHPIAFIDRLLVHYARSEDGLSRDKLTLRRNSLRLIESCDRLRPVPDALRRRRKSDLTLYCARAHVRAGNGLAARAALYQAWRLFPLRRRVVTYAAKCFLLGRLTAGPGESAPIRPGTSG